MLRLMEFCGLLLDDIVTDAPIPFIQIRDNAIRRVKTEEASERNIPVPSELVRLGFLDYVARLRQGDHKLLFPDLLFRGNKTDFGSLYNKQWSKRLDAILPEARSQKKTTHSFRKGGNSMMRKRGIDVSIRHEILGHAQQGTNAEHYLEDTDMSGKSEALSAITIVTGQLQPAPITLSQKITTPAQEENYIADCRNRKQNGLAS